MLPYSATYFVYQKCYDVLFGIKFGYSEKATKFEKIFHLKFDATQ